MTMVIHLLCANLTRDIGVIGKMDPFCAITIGSEKIKSSAHKNGGRKPVWNFDMKFTKSPDIFMKVGVYTSEFFVDTQIGVTTVNLKKFVNSPGVEFTETIEIFHKGQKAGDVVMSVQYIPGSNVIDSATQGAAWNYQPYGAASQVNSQQPWSINGFGAPPFIPSPYQPQLEQLPKNDPRRALLMGCAYPIIPQPQGATKTDPDPPTPNLPTPPVSISTSSQQLNYDAIWNQPTQPKVSPPVVLPQNPYQ